MSRCLVAVALLALFALPASAEREIAGRTLKGWRTDLASRNETVRLRAAKTIGLFGADALDAWREMLRHADPSVRYWAASHLGDLGAAAEVASARIEELVAKDRSLGVRTAAAYALASHRDHPADGLSVLIESLRSKERGLACSAAEFLGRLGAKAKAALPALEEAFKRHGDRASGGDYHVRGAAKNAIRKIRGDKKVVLHRRPKSGGRYRTWLDRASKPGARSSSGDRPNLLWISCEDISTNLGCYGDRYASTPNLDRLARQGARFTNAFTPAGVCAVVRSGLITGVYPISIGSQHMRSRIVPPVGVKCFTEYLRAAGYFCTNKSKTDYQFDPPITAWDRQGNNHNDWRDRGADQPFFSVINLTVSHESQIRHSEQVHEQILARLGPEQRHDPRRAAEFLPPIYPKTPEALKDWAWYSDNISEMDRQVGEILRRLKEDGLDESTVVVFWSDHGRGLPRGKRWIYDSGVHVPLIVRWPGRTEPNSVRDDLVSTEDLAPTMLSLAGAPRQPHMQGRVFLGEQAEPQPEYLFFHRDRMDEAYDLMRAARDHRFKYVRNYEPQKPYAQHIDYMDMMPTLVDLRRLHAEGKLVGPQQAFMRPTKPIEELYDIVNDPHETVNLADQPDHRATLAKMREAVEKWQERIGDMGLIPEPIMMERMRPGGKFQRTAVPQVAVAKGRVSMTCETKGASIAYSLDGKNWRLYSSPVKSAPGQWRVKACRLGFRDSSTVNLRIR